MIVERFRTIKKKIEYKKYSTGSTTTKLTFFVTQGSDMMPILEHHECRYSFEFEQVIASPPPSLSIPLLI